MCKLVFHPLRQISSARFEKSHETHLAAPTGLRSVQRCLVCRSGHQATHQQPETRTQMFSGTQLSVLSRCNTKKSVFLDLLQVCPLLLLSSAGNRMVLCWRVLQRNAASPPSSLSRAGRAGCGSSILRSDLETQGWSGPLTSVWTSVGLFTGAT